MHHQPNVLKNILMMQKSEGRTNLTWSTLTYSITYLFLSSPTLFFSAENLVAFPKHLSPSAEGPSTSLSHYVWFCLCLDSQQTHRPTVYTCTPSRAHFDRMFYRTQGFYLQNKWRKSILPALWNNSNLYGYSGGEHVAATSWCPTSITFGRKILSIATNSMRLCCSDFYTERKIKMCTPSSVARPYFLVISATATEMLWVCLCSFQR